MAPGFFLVLEGVEGVGKTTQAQRIADWLGEIGVPSRLGREPGGTPVGEAVRALLLDTRGLDFPAETELLLMLAARAAFVRQVVRPSLDRGEVMIADRFELSSLAYQGIGRGLGENRVRELNAFATGGLKPNLTLVFDLPVEVGRARQGASGKVRDRIEDEGEAFLRGVREAYRSLSQEDDSVRLVDASASEEEVHQTVRELLVTDFPELFGPRRG